MAAVLFKIYTGTQLKSSGSKDDSNLVPKYVEGQIIFAPGYGKICMDYAGTRTDYSQTASSKNINYIGIADEDPSEVNVDEDANGAIKLIGKDEKYIPNPNDMVVWGKKEYLYRKGENDKLGWYEIGNEDAYNWIESS